MKFSSAPAITGLTAGQQMPLAIPCTNVCLLPFLTANRQFWFRLGTAVSRPLSPSKVRIGPPARYQTD